MANLKTLSEMFRFSEIFIFPEFFIFSERLAKNGGFVAIFARSGSPLKLPLGLGLPQNFTKMSGGARRTFKLLVLLKPTISLLLNML